MYAFSTLEDLEAVTGGPNYYRRYGHLNSVMLERAVADLEGGEAALATGAGMSALTAVLGAVLRRGDRVDAAPDLYGGTVAMLRREMPRLGVKLSSRRAHVTIVETISNPLLRVAPIAELARRRGLLIVDNTFATAAVCRPLSLGADVVILSATKFLGGHSDCVAGVAVGPKRIIEPARRIAVQQGLVASPLDAWLALRGLRTLALRMERACRNAAALARVLRAHRRVKRVHYPDLGAMLSFELENRRAVSRLVRRLRLVRLVPSLGDVATTVSHPASSSHRNLSAAERRRLGVVDGLVRVSVGIEDADDIIADFEGALR